MNENKISCIDDKIKKIAEQNDDLSTELTKIYAAMNKNRDDIRKLKIDKEKLMYGQPASCECCRYNVVLRFSEDGEHKRCGNMKAPCTCCNDKCEYFRPHHEITKYISEHSIFPLSPEVLDALEVLLSVDIFELNKYNHHKIAKIKNLIKCYLECSNLWR